MTTTTRRPRAGAEPRGADPGPGVAPGRQVDPAPERRRRWVLALLVAAAWSVAELAAAVAWLRGAGGSPSVPRPGEEGGLNVLHLLPVDAADAVLAAAGASGLALVAAMVAQRRAGTTPAARRVVAGLTVALGLVLTVVLPDYRLLAWVAYVPIIAVMTVAGTMPAGVEVWPWPVVHMGLATLGGVALLVAAREHLRSAASCTACGRGAGRLGRWAVRHARWAVAVAVVVPVGYAVTRLAWAFGIPLGVRQEFLDQLGDAVLLGGGLGALAIGGAVLTLGLVQRWGEVFPRWMPGVRGRRVPVGLAVVPATLVSFLVTSAALMFVRLLLTGVLGPAVPGQAADVAAWLPELFWPLWGVALALATYAYAVRLRAACPECGRA